MLSTQYFLPICLNIAKLGTVDPPRESGCSQLIFRSRGQRSSQLLELSTQYLKSQIMNEGQLSTANHRNTASKRIVTNFAIKPSR